MLSSMVLSIASILNYSGIGGILIAVSSLLIPLSASLIAERLQKQYLAKWLWAGFLITIPLLGNWLLPRIDGLSSAMLWGVVAAISLGLTITVRSNVCLVVSAFFLMIWSWFAYTSNPPADFLWPHLLLAMLGLAWSRRSNNQVASALFVIALLIWTGFTAQAAMVMQPFLTTQITWVTSLFLLTCLLVLHASSNKKSTPGIDILILIIASVIAASFAFSPFAPSPLATQNYAANFLWVLLAISLLLLSFISLAYINLKTVDRIGIIALLLLTLVGIFASFEINYYPLWLGLGTGTLSFAGIWLAMRGFVAENTIYGFCGLGIWGGSVLLAAHNIDDQWLRIAVLALYSFAAVGFYLASERQRLKKAPKNHR